MKKNIKKIIPIVCEMTQIAKVVNEWNQGRKLKIGKF